MSEQYKNGGQPVLGDIATVPSGIGPRDGIVRVIREGEMAVEWYDAEGRRCRTYSRIEHATLKRKSPSTDLLEACKRTKEILDAWGPERRGHTLELLHDRIEAAIAKAEGAGQ